MLLLTLSNDFLLAAAAEKGCAAQTIRTFRSRIRNFIRFAGDDASLDEFTLPVLKKYLYHLVAKKLRPRTVKAYFDALRAFGSWLVTEKMLTSNPALEVSTPKLDAPRRQPVSDDELRDLLAACDRIANLQRAALARAILSVFAYGGLRREECLSLRLNDVNFDLKCLIVRQGKGKKSRTIYPHPDCLKALREWLRVRPKNCTHDWLFAYQTNRRLHHLGLRTLLEEVKAISGHRSAVHIQPHAIRHNFASRLMRKGADLQSIQDLLGHASIATTAVYLHGDEARLREVAHLGSLEPSGPTAASSDHQPNKQKAGIPTPRSRRIPR